MRNERIKACLGKALPLVVIAAGLALIAWPLAQQWWVGWQASRGIELIASTYDAMNDEQRQALREEACAYNAVLAGDGNFDGRLPYDEQLSFDNSEMIAYINIPKCSVKLPIYHGTEDKVLMAGVGHLRGTSLPVGGTSTHCVLTAHTGMPGRVMFDDIHLLDLGDQFVVWVLGEPLAYEVTGSEVVLPNEVASLKVQEGKDLCTLITCTPYGVNSHRLLVHARRCEYVEEGDVPDIAVYVNRRTLPLLVAFCALVPVCVIWRRRWPSANSAEAL